MGEGKSGKSCLRSRTGCHTFRFHFGRDSCLLCWPEQKLPLDSTVTQRDPIRAAERLAGRGPKRAGRAAGGRERRGLPALYPTPPFNNFICSSQLRSTPSSHLSSRAAQIPATPRSISALQARAPAAWMATHIKHEPFRDCPRLRGRGSPMEVSPTQEELKLTFLLVTPHSSPSHSLKSPSLPCSTAPHKSRVMSQSGACWKQSPSLTAGQIVSRSRSTGR